MRRALSPKLYGQTRYKNYIDNTAHINYVLFHMGRFLKGIRNRLNRLLLYRNNKAVLNLNKNLENTKRGKRCFIMGTGPSIKDQDILKLKNEYTFVVNNFFKHEQFKEIRPKFFAYIDPAGFQDNINGNYWSEQLFGNANLINSVPMTSFFHIKAKNLLETREAFKSHDVHYLAMDGFFKENLNFNTDISNVIPYTKNVIISCIMIATYMGFEEIYLLGCEHDFLASPTNYEWSKHFYKNDDFNMNNPADIKKYNLTVTSYESVINHASKLFQNYRLLKAKLAKEKPNVKIYNATPNSFLDVFPYVKFEDINL